MPLDDEAVGDVLDALTRHCADRLAPREYDFVHDLAAQHEAGTLRLTDRQRAWLDAIAERLLGKG
ncbi:MAG TPA: hypothetical protein VFE48_25475 [Methylomirabilota bacterium]|nr:hypothetical protein [Methylomirabilota bacterium]